MARTSITTLVFYRVLVSCNCLTVTRNRHFCDETTCPSLTWRH